MGKAKTSAKTSAEASTKTTAKNSAKGPAKRSAKTSMSGSAKGETSAEDAVSNTAEPAPSNSTPEQAPSTPYEYQQVAALPTREGAGGTEVCLITTRETRRWTIPKGWPMKGRKDHRAAAIEAREEAGLKGRVEKEAVGSFLYFKRRVEHFDLVRTTVYRLHVTGSLKSWREKGEREVLWVPAYEASMMVEEPGLVAILAGLG